MDKICVKSDKSGLILKNSLIKIVFTKESAGFPSLIAFGEEGDALVETTESYISAELDGRRIIPFLDKNAPEIIEDGSKTEIVYDCIKWKYETGETIEGYRLALSYEIYSDGAVFAKTFFFAETLERQTLRDFRFSLRVNIPENNGARWAYWKCPESSDASIIQDLSNFRRNIPCGENASIENGFFPFVSFDFGQGKLLDKHIEFFFESWNSLTPDYKNTSSEVKWERGGANMSWVFQKESRQTEGRALQWRNIWGFCARRFPENRKNPPFRAFHYLDNRKHYPSDECVKRIANEGANLFILHENWRLDYKQGEFAYDCKRLKSIINLCHRYGIRVMLYVRCNEDGMRFRAGGHLVPRFLKKDYDGIYMDYCAAPVFISKDEYSPGGRIHFYEFDRLQRLYRKTVGDDGLLIGHAGPFFSALGFTQLDAYLGGEQEKGALIKDSATHAYFSGTAVAQSALWTAAFPTYRTRKMLPFMATSFQFPFLHLGAQFDSSSLAHPEVPSLVTFTRPLWRLWELFDGIKNIKTYSTQNRPEIFGVNSEHVGVSSMSSPEGDTLLIVANYLETPINTSLNIDLKKLGISRNAKVFMLSAGYEKCSFLPAENSAKISISLETFGTAGLLFVRDEKQWTKKLKNFIRPYPRVPEEEKKYQDMLENLKRLRFEPRPAKEVYLRVEIPGFADNYEDSLIFDLYDNTIELREILDDGKYKRLGYLTSDGLTGKVPSKAERLYPWSNAAWIPLHKVLRRNGPVKLALATRRGEYEFYSFVKAKLSCKPEITKSSYEIFFNNDIDLDWSELRFNINLK